MEAKYGKNTITKTIEESIDVVKFEFTKEEASEIAERIMRTDWFADGEKHKELIGGLYAIFARAQTTRLNNALKAWKNETEKIVSKYKVGDKVLVRSDLKHGKRYGSDGFDAIGTQMGNKVGKVCTVTEIISSGEQDAGYRLNGERGRFTNEMIVGLASPTKYQVGDKVRVCSDLAVGSSYYGGLNTRNTFVSDMEKFKGCVVTINKITEGNQYRIEGDDGLWRWTDSMFETV